MNIPRYTITIFKNGSPIMAVDQVMGCETEGADLYIWFDPTKIRTCIPLKLNERFTLERDQ